MIESMQWKVSFTVECDRPCDEEYIRGVLIDMSQDFEKQGDVTTNFSIYPMRGN